MAPGCVSTGKVDTLRLLNAAFRFSLDEPEESEPLPISSDACRLLNPNRLRASCRSEFDKMENEKWWVSVLNPPYSHLPSSNCEGVIGTIVNNTYLGDAKFDAPLR